MTLISLNASVTTRDAFFVDGAWAAPASSCTYSIVSPITEELVGTVPEAQNGDADLAIAAARRAFDDPSGWSSWEPARRGEVLRRFADEVEARGKETAQAITVQNGMPIWISEGIEASFPGFLLRYYADLAEKNPKEERRTAIFGGETIVSHEAIGVVAAIVPWNFPQALAFMKLAPALAAGCTVVMKPSPETILDSYIVAEAAIAAGLPAGVLNIIAGGRELGAYLVSHPGVDKVSFTGSTAAGRSIASVCGQLLRPVSLELGGKSAAIFLDDADLDANIDELFGATLQNNGQTCFVSSRILAPRSRYSEVVDAIASLASGAKVGDPLDPSTKIGPLVSARQRDRVESYIAKGISEGGRLVAGGSRPNDLDRGFYVSPTVFADIDNSDTLAQEEIFGPVLVVIPYDDDADAIRIANDSDYGLGGSVWSSDTGRALDVARQVRTGSIGLNMYANDPGSPFGGVKGSGLGRELGPEGMSGYQVLKSIYQVQGA